MGASPPLKLLLLPSLLYCTIRAKRKIFRSGEEPASMFNPKNLGGCMLRRRCCGATERWRLDHTMDTMRLGQDGIGPQN